MKRIIICEDGTWNVPDRKDGDEICPSNVARVALAVAPEDSQGIEQVVRYHPGVGTGRWDRIRGGAFGWGLSRHVQEAYRSIVELYEPGDEIYLFGFSRGAFTARSTAGLIRNSGVLRRDNLHKVGDAYDLYRSRRPEAHPREIEAQLFRRQFSHEPRVRFIGVWDTVGSLGIPDVPWFPLRVDRLNRRWAFHDTDLSTSVDHAYQAVAIDERRAQFAPTLWTQQVGAEDQQMEQVWFAGAHSNIGGGYQDRGLSDITFLWMKDKAEAAGLAFDADYLREHVHPDPIGVLRDSRVGLYKLPFLRGPYERPIGVGERSNESVHPSVLQRRAEMRNPAYEASNLSAYMSPEGTGPAER
jgi:uncharacterized protein (DUF2235 family)